MGNSKGRHFPALSALLAAVALVALTATGARADSCEELGVLKTKREAVLQSINTMVAANKGKQLDAETFCAHARPIVAVDNAFLASLTKNKDWCQIPDEVINQFKLIQAKDNNMASKSCTVAAQMKKAKEQAEAGGGAGMASSAPKLPAGPL
jgi:hypothetical protein